MARGDSGIVAEAKARFVRCQDWESAARRNFRADMKFAEGDANNGWQWDSRQLNDRVGANKPALTINKVRQHNLQIVNDARQNKPQVRVRPVGDQATVDAAQVFEGLIRHIENQSDAQTAYDSATYTQVYGGIGYIRIKTDYRSPDSGLDQEIYIERVRDPLSVYLDPDIERFDGADAKFAFVFKEFPKDTFEKKYPDAKWGSSALGSDDDWHGSDYARVAEYFRITEQSDTLFVVPQGLLPDMQDGGEVKASDLSPEIAAALRTGGIPSRMIKTPTVEWFRIAGSAIIERNTWPGAYIPLARVVGEEIIIDGKMDRKGHTRALIDPQRMYNYWSSSAVEHVALQTKVPFIARADAIEGYEDDWFTANEKNHAILLYKGVDDAGRPIPPPSRSEPPQMPQAYMAGMQSAANELMLASGQYQAEMGAPSNERSGVAINARQRQADNSTYHYVDHLAQAIRHVGAMLIDLIPKVYDVPQVVRILSDDGSETQVQLDPSAPNAHTTIPEHEGGLNPSAIFNPNVGRYEVIADIGPAFATKRQEAFNAMSQLAQQNPEFMKIAGDLYFMQSDFPLADAIAERFRRTIPPQILADADDAPSPQVRQLQQQLQQTQQQLQQMHAALGNATTQISDKQADAARKQAELELDQYRAETDRIKAVGGIDPAAMQPVIRSLVSEVLRTPIVPVMALHAAAEQSMQTPPPLPASATNGTIPPSA